MQAAFLLTLLERFQPQETDEAAADVLSDTDREIVANLFKRICPNGQFSDQVEGVQDGRPDGYHLSSDAAVALARNWLGPIALATGSQPAATPTPTAQPFP